jgi:hypothetical protein
MPSIASTKTCYSILALFASNKHNIILVFGSFSTLPFVTKDKIKIAHHL